MLIVYNKSTGKILAVASSINENGIKREPYKNEIYPHIIGESLYIQDNNEIINNYKDFLVENEEVISIIKKNIVVSGIPTFIEPNSLLNIGVRVNGYNGKLQIVVSRGKLSSREIDVYNGEGNFTLQVPDETISISLSIFNKNDDTIQPYQKVLEVG